MHFIVMRNEKASFAEARCMMYLEGGDTSVTVALEVEGSNIVTCA